MEGRKSQGFKWWGGVVEKEENSYVKRRGWQ